MFPALPKIMKLEILTNTLLRVSTVSLPCGQLLNLNTKKNTLL